MKQFLGSFIRIHVSLFQGKIDIIIRVISDYFLDWLYCLLHWCWDISFDSHLTYHLSLFQNTPKKKKTHFPTYYFLLNKKTNFFLANNKKPSLIIQILLWIWFLLLLLLKPLKKEELGFAFRKRQKQTVNNSFRDRKGGLGARDFWKRFYLREILNTKFYLQPNFYYLTTRF